MKKLPNPKYLRVRSRCGLTLEQWNELGETVVVEVLEDKGGLTITTTRGPGWRLGHGAPVVPLSDRTGGYALERLKQTGPAVDREDVPRERRRDEEGAGNE